VALVTPKGRVRARAMMEQPVEVRLRLARGGGNSAWLDGGPLHRPVAQASSIVTSLSPSSLEELKITMGRSTYLLPRTHVHVVATASP
jgi:hypothetical protein